MRKYYSLYGRLLSKTHLLRAFKHVKRAKGAAGIDGQSLSDFDQQRDRELDRLLHELKTKTYQPQAVLRVEIPKDDGGVRGLGIPCVRDRVVQQALRDVLEPIFDEDFHPSSYGYRKGRSCHHAITKASDFIRRYGRQWVADMDLSKCFDTLDHERIVASFKRKITDGSILKLLKAFLACGVMNDFQFEETTRGSPQGGVISPLIANVYLDAFDQMMKGRGHRIVRYADDILIVCCSASAAENALQVATNYLEEELKLEVNQTKTHIAHSDEGIKFLGVEIFTQYTRIQEKKVRAFKAKVKTITRRNTGHNLAGVISELNPVLRGFINYFKIANCKREMRRLMGWIRRRLRCIQLLQWKKPGRLHRRLRQLGYRGRFMRIRMRSWRSSRSPLASLSMPNRWFHGEMNLVNLTEEDFGVSAREIGSVMA